MKEELIQSDLVLTERAVHWVSDNIKPICSTDFIGYIFDMNDILYPLKKYKNPVGFAVDWKGHFRIYSKDPKHPILSNFKAKRFLKKLFKLKFLERTMVPFPEFDVRYNIPVDSDSTTFIEEPLFQGESRSLR